MKIVMKINFNATTIACLNAFGNFCLFVCLERTRRDDFSIQIHINNLLTYFIRMKMIIIILMNLLNID